jgi:hypothetical protein
LLRTIVCSARHVTASDFDLKSSSIHPASDPWDEALSADRPVIPEVKTHLPNPKQANPLGAM